MTASKDGSLNIY